MLLYAGDYSEQRTNKESHFAFNAFTATQYCGGYARRIKFVIRIISEVAQNFVTQFHIYEEIIKLDDELLKICNIVNRKSLDGV